VLRTSYFSHNAARSTHTYPTSGARGASDAQYAVRNTQYAVRSMKIIIIGLGNPILTDDGVGVKVAYAVRDALASAARNGVTVTEASVGGLRLMEMMEGYDRVILVDAIQTADGQPGTIYRLTLDDIASAVPTQHSASAHDMNLPTAMEMGRCLGMALPASVEIFAIEALDVVTFGETCTPHVTAAIPAVTELVLETLTQLLAQAES
jgi:hydrogenase maturation protease